MSGLTSAMWEASGVAKSNSEPHRLMNFRIFPPQSTEMGSKWAECATQSRSRVTRYHSTTRALEVSRARRRMIDRETVAGGARFSDMPPRDCNACTGPNSVRPSRGAFQRPIRAPIPSRYYTRYPQPSPLDGSRSRPPYRGTLSICSHSKCQSADAGLTTTCSNPQTCGHDRQ